MKKSSVCIPQECCLDFTGRNPDIDKKYSTLDNAIRASFFLEDIEKKCCSWKDWDKLQQNIFDSFNLANQIHCLLSLYVFREDQRLGAVFSSETFNFHDECAAVMGELIKKSMYFSIDKESKRPLITITILWQSEP